MSARNFVRNNGRFDMSGINEVFGKQALVIGLKLNWIGLVCLLLSNLIVCFSAGILVGFWTRRADLGFAVTSGMAGIISCLAATLHLAWK
jgi:hypothetical protein